MDNIDLTLLNLKNSKAFSEGKKNKTSSSSFNKLYQKMVDSKIRREREEEYKKRNRLASIIQKLLAGIPLTSDEMQFLKVNAPVYYNKAMRRQRNYMTANAGQDSISEIDAIDTIKPIGTI